MKSHSKKCILDDHKLCNNCQNCMYCDLNPENLCNNCAACIKSDADFKSIIIDDILLLEEDLEQKEKHET